MRTSRDDRLEIANGMMNDSSLGGAWDRGLNLEGRRDVMVCASRS
jgi:hypothetical protein